MIAVKKNDKWELEEEFVENYHQRYDYKVIKEEHEYLALEWLTDNSVEIEAYRNDRWWTESEGFFIENYNPDFEYRLKNKFRPKSIIYDDYEEKEDGTTNIRDKQSDSVIKQSISDSPPRDNSIVTLCNSKEINNFQDYGFTGDFEGGILKKCSRCNMEKPLTLFTKNKKNSDGLQSQCKECRNKAMKEKRRTKIGLVNTLYNNHKANSKYRGYAQPTYSKEELKDWLFSKELFHVLFDNWKASGFNKESTPSIDRVNDYVSYTLANISLTTWAKNRERYAVDAINGVNNKQNYTVIQRSLDGSYIDSFYSASEAGRRTGFSMKGISRCCRGERNHYKGFIWEYETKTERDSLYIEDNS